MAPLIFGFFANYYGAIRNPRVYGYLVTAAVTLGYLGSNIFYYKAGKEYSKMMTERDENEKNENEAKKSENLIYNI
jgi:hypothetical protein